MSDRMFAQLFGLANFLLGAFCAGGKDFTLASGALYWIGGWLFCEVLDGVWRRWRRSRIPEVRP